MPVSVMRSFAHKWTKFRFADLLSKLFRQIDTIKFV